MNQDVLVVTSADRVRTLRMNRPARDNRLNIAMLERLSAALNEADADPGVHVVVLTGTDRVFCCGGDTAELSHGDEHAYRTFGRLFANVHLRIDQMRKPVIAAVNGDVRAGGMSLLSVTDVAVARGSARFAMPEIASGLWPVMASVPLNRILSRKQALELYYFGESFDAQRARDLGLVNWVIRDEDFEATVREKAARLAELPPETVRIGRTTLSSIQSRDLADGLNQSIERLVELFAAPDTKDALKRHLEIQP